MKTLIILVSFVVFLGYGSREQKPAEQNGKKEINNPELHCPSAPSFAEKIMNDSKKKDQPAGEKNVDQNWFRNTIKDIQKEEYNITYSEELGTYQSPNRRNNLRFIYNRDGFTAQTKSTRIPKFDVNGKSLKEEEKEHEIPEEFEISLRITNDEFRITENNLNASGNKAWIENEKIRIDYTNNEDGMRQDFIIKQKPVGIHPFGTGEEKLRLNIAAETKLKMIVGADALMFKNDKGEEKMKYSSLKVWDANGKPLRAYFEKNLELGIKNYELRAKSKIKIIPNSFSIVVNDAEAVYPVTIDPISSSSVWSVTGEAVSDLFGSSVATAGDVNGDGYSDVLVGANQFGANSQGKAYLYYGSVTGLSSTPGWTKTGSINGSNFGSCVATAGDVNGDGYSDIIISEIGWGDPISKGRVQVFYGSATGPGNSANWTKAGTQSGEYYGWSVSSAGDVNGDGYSDILIGAPGNDFPGEDAGLVDVFHGSASGLGLTPARTWDNATASGGFGTSVSSAGDVNGDGYSDVVVGEPYYLTQGRVSAYYGSASGLPVAANFTKFSTQANSEYGNCVSAAGDVDNDGYSDVIVAAQYYSNGQAGEGVVYLYRGSASGLVSNPAWTAEGGSNDCFFGTFVSTAGDPNGDGYADVLIGARGFYSNDGFEGKIFAYFGSATGLGAVGNPDNADWSVEENQQSAEFGSWVTLAGDVNGDGFSDIIASASYFDANLQNQGKVFLYNGSSAGLSAAANWTGESNQNDSWYGWSVSSAGDVNGDSYSDVIVGAYLFDNGQNDEGKVFLYYGSDAGLSSTPAWTCESNSAGAQFGYSVSTAGDINGDGYSDLVVGANTYLTSVGRAYFFHGSSTGPGALWNYSITGDAVNCNYANSVASAGDVNGDGYSDVIIGASNAEQGLGNDNEGIVYIYHGGASGLNTSPAYTVEGNQANAGLGYSVASAGDVNGDGYSDIIAGANTFDNGQNDEGRALVYYGSVTGISGSQTVLEINSLGAQFGFSVAGAGDINGDGYSDVIVGAPYNGNGETQEGGAFVYLGSSSGLSTVSSWSAESNQSLSNFGISVASAGDVNGDGYSDAVVGALNYDNGQTDEGRAYVYHGSSIGLSSTANWTAESNLPSSKFGASVSSAGDVNGDGYSDLIVGAYRFTNVETDEGRAFMYYGNSSDGRRTNIQQYRPATSTVVSSGGLSAVNGGVKFSLHGKSPFGKTDGRIAYEYKTNGVPFGGSIISNGTGVSGTGNFTDLGLSGADLTKDITGLQTGKLYRWRARVQYDLATNPYQKYGPWKYYNNYNPTPHGNFRPSDGTTLNKALNLTMLLQGFYNSLSNTLTGDTVTVYIRSSTNPFVMLDSAKAKLSSTGQATLFFTGVSNGIGYYLHVKHRNSIETWSKTPQTFTGGVMNYDFSNAASKAFGDNMKQVDASPVRFAIYGGDVNQDGTIDATDVSTIDNDASNFVGGYVVTDLTGDDFVDGTDFAIADNNAANFVSAVTP
jgi:hypothetical protein